MEWTKLGETSLRVGFRKVLMRTFRLPDGRIEEFTIKCEGVSVCILPMTADGHVVLAKQFRPGPEAVVLELPGGGIEPGESLEEAAQRELLEETGYAGELRFVTTALDCGYSTARRAVFVATNCVKIQEPHLDDAEFIETVLMPISEFRAHLRSGNLTDIEVGYLGLDYLGFLGD